jgi:hypothetical protein
LDGWEGFFLPILLSTQWLRRTEPVQEVLDAALKIAFFDFAYGNHYDFMLFSPLLYGLFYGKETRLHV